MTNPDIIEASFNAIAMTRKVTLEEFNERLPALRARVGDIERHENEDFIWITPWDSDKVLMEFVKSTNDMTIFFN